MAYPAGLFLGDWEGEVDFGSVALGSSAEAVAVTLRNTGVDDVTGLAIGIDWGDDRSDPVILPTR